jgi:flavodoxin
MMKFMNALIVYDSQYGNTEKIARAIGDAIPGVRVIHASETNPSDLESVDLLIVGSPTHGGRPMGAVQTFLVKVPANAIKGIYVTAFDTRFSSRLTKIFGYAAGRIVIPLKRKGGNLLVEPEAFYVEGTKGPLKEGELERAAGWAEEVLKGIQ